jgi:hypothetical protein
MSENTRINREEVWNTIKLFGDSGCNTVEVAEAMGKDAKIVGFVITNLVMVGRLEDLGMRRADERHARRYYRVRIKEELRK